MEINTPHTPYDRKIHFRLGFFELLRLGGEALFGAPQSHPHVLLNFHLRKWPIQTKNRVLAFAMQHLGALVTAGPRRIGPNTTRTHTAQLTSFGLDHFA